MNRWWQDDTDFRRAWEETWRRFSVSRDAVVTRAEYEAWVRSRRAWTRSLRRFRAAVALAVSLILLAGVFLWSTL